MKTVKDVLTNITKWLGSKSEDVKHHSVVHLSLDQFINSVKLKHTRVTDSFQNSEYDQKIKYPLFIMGLTGTGKTWLANQVGSINPQLKIFDSDTAAEERKGRWIIDLEKVPEGANVISGSGDGTLKLVEQRKGSIVLPFPTSDSYRRIQSAKALDSKDWDLPIAWKKGWASSSKVSDSNYYKKMYDEIRFLISRTSSDVDFYLVTTPDIKSSSKIKGWF